MPATVGVAIIGYQTICKARSHAYRTAHLYEPCNYAALFIAAAVFALLGACPYNQQKGSDDGLYPRSYRLMTSKKEGRHEYAKARWRRNEGDHDFASVWKRRRRDRGSSCRALHIRQGWGRLPFSRVGRVQCGTLHLTMNMHCLLLFRNRIERRRRTERPSSMNRVIETLQRINQKEIQNKCTGYCISLLPIT
jgi:hypothetical protein